MKGLLVAAVATLLSGCITRFPELPPSMIPEPAPAEVETVVFLVGDAGYATEQNSPLMHALRGDVEAWSRQLTGDTAVVVVFLGDIVYPDGMGAPEEPDYPTDSLIVQAQANVVAGPESRKRAWGVFLAGNHDWGNARDTEGVQRLQELEKFLDRQRARGLNVRLLPEAGEPGPALMDVGDRLTLLLYDTAWWLLAQDAVRKARLFSQTEYALRRSEGRIVVFAAHHPWTSASSHGGSVRFWKTFGLRWLLNRSGAILQDLNSVPYRELTSSLRESFLSGAPLIWAGGHDHALQVLEGGEPGEPRYTIVSGSGSKVSDIGYHAGMRYRHEGPGYGKIYIRRDGRVDFIMVEAGEEHLECSGSGAALEECLREGIAAFRPGFGQRLQ